MPRSTFETFVRFGTDNAGLERLLRLVQSLLQITISYPLPLALLIHLLSYLPSSASSFPSTSHSATLLLLTLTLLRSRINLARRFLRMFRFLDAFTAAHKSYLALGEAEGERLTKWLDVGAKSFNGCYLLLETAMLADAMEVEGLSVFGRETATGRMLVVEGQRFWFFALLCGVAGGGLGGWRDGVLFGGGGGGGGGGEMVEEKVDGKDGERYQEIIRQRAERKRAVQFRRTRKLVADVLDLALPGSVVGWVPLGAGPVGLAMLGSTVLTGWEVWERCRGE